MSVHKPSLLLKNEDLLKILTESKVGCFVGKMFVSLFAYAGDILSGSETSSAVAQRHRQLSTLAEVVSTAAQLCETKSQLKGCATGKYRKFM